MHECLLLVPFNLKPHACLSTYNDKVCPLTCCTRMPAIYEDALVNAAGRIKSRSPEHRCAMIHLINYSCQRGQPVLVPPIFMLDRRTP